MSIESLESVLISEKNLTSYDITDDDVVEPWENLIQHLTIKNLDDLRQFFTDELEDSQELKLNKEEFMYAIDTVIGNSKYSLQAISLYNEIPYSDKDKITWNQFLDYYIDHGITEDVEEIQFPQAEIFSVRHVERETIMKIVSIETDTSFCYAIISKYGKIGLYTGEYTLIENYQVIFTRNDKFLTEKYRRIKSIWITDAIFISRVNIFIVCNTSRSVIFYDASGQRHVPLWLIEGLPNAIYSLEYYFDLDLKLFMGDDLGSITIMTFLNLKYGLLRRKHNDKITHFYWKELSEEITFVQTETFKKIHSNIVLNMSYYPETHSLVSCSRDKKYSLVFFNLKEKRRTHKLQISQGVSCFALNHRLHILIIGSDSGIIQLWNLYVRNKATDILQGHKTAVIDVKILAFKNVAITCSRDAVKVLKIWSLQNQKSLQEMNLKFPCLDVLGKFIEWGTSTIYSGPKRYQNLQSEKFYAGDETKSVQEISQHKENKDDIWQRSPILITCCNFIAKIKINNEENANNDILPAPPLQNEIIIPKDWKIEDKNVDSIEISKPQIVKIDNLEERYPVVKDIMNRDFLKNMPREKHDINYKIATLERKKLNMIKPILQCAPFIALDLYEVEEVKLSPDLPVPNCKRTQQIVERTHRLLSAASSRSEILSDRSSKSRSSRSSIVEF